MKGGNSETVKEKGEQTNNQIIESDHKWMKLDLNCSNDQNKIKSSMISD